jgi:hypothetical protein
VKELECDVTLLGNKDFIQISVITVTGYGHVFFQKFEKSVPCRVIPGEMPIHF